MKRLDAGALVVVIGAFALWMGITETALLYVRPSARLWLTVAGATLLFLGTALLVLSLRARRRGEAPSADGSHASNRRHAARVGWMLALPIAISMAVGSNPLGSYAAGRQNSQRVLPPGEFDLEQYLTAGSFGGQAPPLRVMDFIRAAGDDEDQALLADTRITLTGFVTEDDAVDDPHHFFLTRFTIGCCAADAIALFVRVDLDDHHIPAADTWVEVEGTLDPSASDPDDPINDPPVLVAHDVREADRPSEVYEYPP